MKRRHLSRRSGLRAAALAFLTCASCTRQVNIDGAPPDDVARVAILELDADGRVLATSALRELTRDRPLWIEAHDDRDALLVGFDNAALIDPETGALAATIDTDPVAVASSCDPELAEPRWVARVRDGAIATVEASEAPPLTVAWLESRCRVPIAFDVDARCAEPRCEERTTRDGPCGARVETTGCVFGTIALRYQDDDLRCLELSESTWSCERNAAFIGERTVFNCGLTGTTPSCPVELIPESREETPPFDLERVSFGLLDPLPHPMALTDRNDLERYIYHWGQAFDVSPIGTGERLVVAAIAGDSREPCRTSALPRRFVFVDAALARVVATSTAPDCLEALAPELDGPGFVGGFHDGLPKLGRFAAGGRLLHAVPVDTSSRAATRFVAAIVPLESMYVVMLESRSPTELASELVFFDREPAIIGRRDTGDYLDGVSALSADEIVVWERDATSSDSGVRIMRVPSGEVVDRSVVPLFTPFRPTASISAGDRMVMFSGDDKSILLYTLRPLVSRRVFGVVGELGYVVSADQWPGSTTPLIVGGGAGDDDTVGFRPELYFLDLAEERFLAGPRAIDGIGPISRVRADGRGNVWMLIPWSGVLVRLTPLSR